MRESIRSGSTLTIRYRGIMAVPIDELSADGYDSQFGTVISSAHSASSPRTDTPMLRTLWAITTSPNCLSPPSSPRLRLNTSHGLLPSVLVCTSCTQLSTTTLCGTGRNAASSARYSFMQCPKPAIFCSAASSRGGMKISLSAFRCTLAF